MLDQARMNSAHFATQGMSRLARFRAGRAIRATTVPTAPARSRARSTPTPTQRRMRHAHSVIHRNILMLRARGGASVELDFTYWEFISVDHAMQGSSPIRQTLLTARFVVQERSVHT